MPTPLPPARRAALRRRLLAWYDAAARPLPWRVAQHGADPYRVWLAEAMLQQTQVARVIPYYLRFLEALPTLEALAAAPEDQVLALWSGLGYYARARALRRAAQAARSRHGGLPDTAEDLRRLPGFGPYTAGAVASIAFARREPAVDGNVARVLARLCLVSGDPASPATRRTLWALAGELVDPVRPGDWNQALMELGATLCGARAPACARCPVAGSCAARLAGRERQVPPPRRRAPRRALTLACAVLERRGRLLLVRRPSGGLFGGTWALPSAELEPGAAPAALGATLRRELGAKAARVGPEVARTERLLTHRALVLVGYRCEVGVLRRQDGARWVARADLDGLGVASAMRALISQV
ncbi:MAG: A/G-specific adenine glycosylase [Anaeromyxobacter sp.]|nr:A/G-specific adenine glycosylase [Anaeromyxobacter sp.]MBL0277647.1 A/G-specific adenine glycosylase [Anaeromyxobacter sp.]